MYSPNDRNSSIYILRQGSESEQSITEELRSLREQAEKQIANAVIPHLETQRQITIDFFRNRFGIEPPNPTPIPEGRHAEPGPSDGVPLNQLSIESRNVELTPSEVAKKVRDAQEINIDNLRFIPRGSSTFDSVIWADINKLDEQLRRNLDTWVGPGGVGPSAVPGRYDDATDFLKRAADQGVEVWTSEVAPSVSGPSDIGVADGRHRLSVLRDAGVKRVPISVPKRSRGLLFERIGTVNRTLTDKQTIPGFSSGDVLPPGNWEAGFNGAATGEVEKVGLRGAAAGSQTVGVFTDVPAPVRAAVRKGLREIFNADYWQRNFHRNTRSAIRSAINGAVRDGVGVREVARRIRHLPAFDRVRAFTVGRTESTAGLNYGAWTMQGQDMADGVIDGRRWRAVIDSATRGTHLSVNGQVKGPGDTWSLGGNPARFPGDPNLPAGERVNCLLPGVCVEGQYDASICAHYSGPAVRIQTRSGTVGITPRHPVATPSGFIPAGSVKSGDYVLKAVRRGDQGRTPMENSSTIENVHATYDSLTPEELFHPTRPTDLYGEGGRMTGSVRILFPDPELIKALQIGSIPEIQTVLCQNIHLDLYAIIQCYEGLVTFECVESIEKFDYSGWVYDLQSPSGIIIAEGFIVSNCRCVVTPHVKVSKPL